MSSRESMETAADAEVELVGQLEASLHLSDSTDLQTAEDAEESPGGKAAMEVEEEAVETSTHPSDAGEGEEGEEAARQRRRMEKKKWKKEVKERKVLTEEQKEVLNAIKSSLSFFAGKRTPEMLERYASFLLAGREWRSDPLAPCCWRRSSQGR